MPPAAKQAPLDKLPPVSDPVSAEDRRLLSDNKYSERRKIGHAYLGNPTTVETIGLGKLKVITANGISTDV